MAISGSLGKKNDAQLAIGVSIRRDVRAVTRDKAVDGDIRATGVGIDAECYAVQTLLEAGANVNAVGDTERNPIACRHWAREHRHH
jgi:hypothetical protein